MTLQSRWDTVRAQKRSERGPVESEHLCHALGCHVAVAPKLLMCGSHWRLVPKVLQRRVWATYVPGQEITKDPSREYIEAAREAVAFVVRIEESRRRPPDSIQEAMF